LPENFSLTLLYYREHSFFFLIEFFTMKCQKNATDERCLNNKEQNIGNIVNVFELGMVICMEKLGMMTRLFEKTTLQI